MNRKNANSTIILTFFIGLLLMPAMLYLFGSRATEFEERPLNAAPDLDTDRLFDPQFYSQLNGFLSDNNPIREMAVVANARLSYFLFQDIAGQQVLSGKNRWLFMRQTIETECVDKGVLAQQVENFAAMQRSLSIMGKPSLVSIAPDKAAIYPEYLDAASVQASECAVENRRAIRDLMKAQNDIKFLDSWALLGEYKQTSNYPIYSPDDTHWTEFGSTAFVAQLVATFASDLGWTGMEQTGTQVVKPDLNRMAGMYYFRDRSTVHFIREGRHNRNPTSIELDRPGNPYVHNVSTSDTLSMSNKKVLFVHDSFLYVAWDQVAQFFSDVLYVHWSSLTPESFASLALEADIVIFETVEREAYDRMKIHFSDALYTKALDHAVATLTPNKLNIWPK